MPVESSRFYGDLLNAVGQFFQNLNISNLSVSALREKGLEYWRERIYAYALAISVGLGFFALIPNILFSFSSGPFWIGFFESFVYLYLLALLFFRRSNYKFRASQLILLNFLIGLSVFYFTGHEAGMFWLFLVPPLASQLFGLRWGLNFLGLNTALILFSGYLVSIESTLLPGLLEFTTGSWVVFSLNLLIANALITISMGALLEGVFRSVEHERKTIEDYRLLFENNPLPMWVYDVETLRFLEVNGAAVYHYGYSREEFFAKTIKDIRPPEQVRLLEENLLRTSRQTRQSSGPWKHTKRNGTLIDVEIFSHSVEFLNRPARLVLANNITERIRAEEKLQQSDQILQKIRSLVLVLDSQGEIIYASPASQEILGYSPEEILGEGWWRLTRADPAEAEGEKENLRRVIRGEASLAGEPYEREIRARTGGTRWIEWQDSIGPGQTLIGVGLDITERKKWERAERASEERYRRLVETAEEGIWITNTKFETAFVNNKMASLLGYRPEEMLGQPAHNFLNEDEQQKTTTRLERRRRGKREQFEVNYRRKDGTGLWAIVAASPIMDDAGQYAGSLAMVTDITERKEAERAVRESEELYRDLADNSRTLICTHDLDGKLLSANDAAIRLTGYSATNLLKMNLADLIVPERRVLLIRYLRRIKTVGKAYGLMEIQTANGERRIWEYHSVLRTERVAAPIVRGMAQDITERKRAEADLLLFRQLIDQSNDAIEVLDPETGHFLDVNVKACLDLGYSRDEYLSLSIFDIDPTVSQSAFAVSKRKLNETGALLWEGLHRRKDGSTFPVEISLRNVRLDREYLVSVARDITERKEAEEARRGNEERYRKLFENMLNGFAYCQMLFDENDQPIDFIYLEVNRAFEDLTGLKNIVGKKVTEAIPGIKESNPELFEIYGRVALTGTPERLEIFVDPLKMWLTISVYSPERGFFIAVFDNISERKQAEEKVRRQLDHLTALADIDRAILSSFNLELNLDMLVKIVVAQMDVDAAIIMVFDPVLQNLESFSGFGFLTNAFEHRKLRLGEGNAGQAALERRVVHVPNLAEQKDNPRLARALAGEKFVSYFGVPLIAKGQVKGVLEIFHRSPLEPNQEWLGLLNTLAGQAAIAIDNVSLFENLQKSNMELSLAYDATIEGWSHALDLRDRETEGHTRRVTRLALKLARNMGVKDEDLVHFRRGALLHDIGKMGIGDEILLKPSKLTRAEWEIMRQHPVYAREMLLPVMYLKDALDIPYSHHEKWNGSGYPLGLKGKGIPLTARIFAVVDVYDALTSDRPYRKAWTKNKALVYIRKQSGKHFDPKVVKAFFKLELT